jgi:predicted TIM-barrel fold metal-dependent hydrolase
MKRRQFLASAAALGLAGACGLAFDEGLINPCLPGPIPEHLLNHEVVRAAWAGIDATKLWDAHVHLAGVGHGHSGIWISPEMQTWLHPWQNLQRRTYLNAACIQHPDRIDQGFLQRLLLCLEPFPLGAKAVLLAFDFNYDEQSRRREDLSAFYIPNGYAAQTARAKSDRLEWMCSVHPYRTDALDELERCAANGAVAVKWLPSAMGMDPASPRCDSFYAALARRRLPLLTHGGEEMAVHGGRFHELNNPLRLRRPLDQGVRVIIAHCASLGSHQDLDARSKRRAAPAFELFARLMRQPAYEGRLFGDVAAVTQTNRAGTYLEVLLRRADWHRRLINGSDYPLPGVIPLFSPRRLTEEGFLTENAAQVISAIRPYNPLLFDFVLKRSLIKDRQSFAPVVFESRRVLASIA